MMNGNGPDDPHGEETPNERPEATLAEHRGYVMALLSASTALHGTAQTFQEIARELRIARDPIGAGTKRRITEAFEQLEQVGQAGREKFGG
jgi:hypothetical protein